MRNAIEEEAQRTGIELTGNDPSSSSAIQFSPPRDLTQEGRLWAHSECSNFDAIRRAVKRQAFYDRELGIWVKQASKGYFQSYKQTRQKYLQNLVEENQRYAVEVLGATIISRDV